MTETRKVVTIGAVRGYAVCLIVVGMSHSVGALVDAGPSFDCDMAQTQIEMQICGSPELAGLDRTVAQRYHALGKDIRPEALRNGIVQDQREWLKNRDACGEQANVIERENCLRVTYQQRRLQLDFHRSVFLGPPLPHPLRIGCDQSAGSQVEIRRCLNERSRYVSRTLRVASETAPGEMRELDRVTSADVGAEEAFLKSRQTYGPYRDAMCSAVAASYAGGSGAGIAELSCHMEMDWARAQRIASDFLFRPPHWTEALDVLSASIRACLAAVEGEGADPRVTAIMETDDGGQRVRIAASDGWRGECVTTSVGAVASVTEVNGMDVWPGEGQALFWPKGSRIGTAHLQDPPYDPCSLYRWVATRNGDLSGWIQLTLCW